MAAFVAVRPEDRQIVRSWFLTVVGGSRGVGLLSIFT